MKNSLTNLPNICKEWNQKRNGELKLEDFTTGSHQKVWWKCQVDETHEWQAVIYSRTGQDGHGCPYCDGQKPTNSNHLLVNFPELEEEWHPTKNGKLTPYDVMDKSGKQVWWICPRGHEWRTKVEKRTRGTGCPKCDNKTSRDTGKNFMKVSKYVGKIIYILFSNDS